MIIPASGLSSPATRRSKVVLPAPVGPSKTTNSPLGMVRLTSFAASTSPKRLVTRSMTTSAMSHLFEQAALQCSTGDGIEYHQSLPPESQSDLLAHAHSARRGKASLQLSVLCVHGHDLHGTHVLGAEHFTAHAVIDQLHVLWTHAQRKLPIEHAFAQRRDWNRVAIQAHRFRARLHAGIEAQEVHGRVADESGDMHGE